MSLYYYLMSSLPDLKSDEKSPITYSEFLSMCETATDKETYETLKNLTLDSTDAPLLKEWAKSYSSFIGELNNERRINLGKTLNKDYESDFYTKKAVTEVLSSKNPLAAEEAILKYEFDLIDSLLGMHIFDEYSLIGYAIKLKLLERKDCFTVEKGKKEFENLFTTVQSRVYNL